jgi:hypothetical protein
MQVRTWAFVGGAVLLIVGVAVGTGIRSKKGGTPAAATSKRRGGAANAGPPATPPDLSKVGGSCLQEDAEGGLICTDYFGTPDEMKVQTAKCSKGSKYTSAAWSEKPCDHATSHGGCWSSRQNPQRIRWFFGKLNADFQPGRDTHKVCGSYSLGYRADGTPVTHRKGAGSTDSEAADAADSADAAAAEQEP